MRNRVLTIFDGAYSAQGLAVYSAITLLTRQIGPEFTCQVVCKGRYLGPRFAGAASITVHDNRHRPGSISGRLRGFARVAAERLRLREAASRWQTSLEADETRMLRHLFDADGLHAVIVFTSDPLFGLRVCRLAHIYATAQCPHLVVVSASEQVDSHLVEDFRWLRVRLMRDGDRVVAPPPPRWHPAAGRAPAARAPADTGQAGQAPAGQAQVRPAPADSRQADSGQAESGQADSGSSDPARAETIPSVFSFLAPEEYPRQNAAPCEQIDWPALISAAVPYPRRVRDVVLFVRPDWANCGSFTTFGNLARWFRARDALLVDVGIWPYGDNFRPDERAARLAAAEDAMHAALSFSVRRSRCPGHILGTAGLLLRWFPRTLARQKMYHHALAAKPRMMREAIRHAKISIIYMNHYFTYAYASSFVAERPFFLDTHDIQTVNFIHHNQHNMLTRRADRFSTSLRDEMEIAGLAARLCFVSEMELETAALFIDRQRLDYALPVPDVTACTPRKLGKPAQLLIVSSDNPANVQSLTWFFTNVWPIVLRADHEGGKPLLRVCGTIGAVMKPMSIPGVVFTGVVPSLWRHYQEADLVLLPVTSGAGVAIKTLEAVMHHRAVIATRHALRGLPEDVRRMIGHEDDPAAYAQSILSLITDEARHRARTSRSVRAAELLLGYSFYHTLAKGVEAVRLTDRAAARQTDRAAA